MDANVVAGAVVVALIAGYLLGVLHGIYYRKHVADRMIERELSRELARVPNFGPDPVSMAARLECDLATIHRYFMGKAMLHQERKEKDSAAGAAEMVRRAHGTWIIANTLLRKLTEEARCSSKSTG